MEELRYNDPDYSPEFFELATCRSTEETHVKQPTTHSRFQYNPSEDFIPITERKWIDTTANEYCKKCTLETSISKLVIKLVGHVDLQERESDGAVNWKTMGPKLRRKEPTKHDCNTARTPATLYYFRAIQGHTVGDVIAPELMGHCRYPMKMERIPISPRMFM